MIASNFLYHPSSLILHLSGTLMKGLLFTYLMTYGGGLLALFTPFYGLLVYVCFAIVKPDAMWSWSVRVGARQDGWNGLPSARRQRRSR